MPRLPRWRRLLEESRRQALVAIDFYNRPGDRRSYSDFIVHLHLAWQDLILASRMKNDRQIYYQKNGRYKKTPDGSRKTWDLSRCLKEEYPETSPIRKNLEFFIGLRNRIEHNFEDNLLVVTAPEAHACIINYETELIRRFGDDFTLGNELKIPIFIHSLQPAEYDYMAEMRRGIPTATLNYISEFVAELPDEVTSNEKFSYRLALMPVKGPKTQADMALSFVNTNDLNEDEKLQLMGKEGSVIIAEKFRNVVHGDQMLPGKIAQEVEARIPFSFGVNDFTRLRKEWGIGPAKSGDKKALPNSDAFCLYSPAFQQFVYTPKLLDRIVEAIRTEGGYTRIFGKEPRLKLDG